LEETRASSSGQHITVKKRKEKPKTASTSFQLSPIVNPFFIYALYMEKTIFDSDKHRSIKNEFISTHDTPVRHKQMSKRKKTQKPK